MASGRSDCRSSPCRFASSLEPEWAAAASTVKEQTGGRVRLGAVDATVHQGVSSRYGVSENPERSSRAETRWKIQLRNNNNNKKQNIA